jgi:hypothetical protein
MQMKYSILILAAVCAVVSVLTFGTRAHADDGWALQVCAAAVDLCHRPLLFAVASAGLAAIWLMAALARAFVE